MPLCRETLVILSSVTRLWMPSSSGSETKRVGYRLGRSGRAQSDAVSASSGEGRTVCEGRKQLAGRLVVLRQRVDDDLALLGDDAPLLANVPAPSLRQVLRARRRRVGAPVEVLVNLYPVVDVHRLVRHGLKVGPSDRLVDVQVIPRGRVPPVEVVQRVRIRQPLVDIVGRKYGLGRRGSRLDTERSEQGRIGPEKGRGGDTAERQETRERELDCGEGREAVHDRRR